MGKILLKFLITAYAITTALLLLLALFVYKCYLPDKAVNACIIVIYILSTFLAGFLSGKRIAEISMGTLYRRTVFPCPCGRFPLYQRLFYRSDLQFPVYHVSLPRKRNAWWHDQLKGESIWLLLY